MEKVLIRDEDYDIRALRATTDEDGSPTQWKVQGQLYSPTIIDLGRSSRPAETTVKSPEEFLGVLKASANYGATNRRDVVYAVLGMCGVHAVANTSEDEGPGVVVDYNRTVAQVHQDALFYLLRTSPASTLKIFSLPSAPRSTKTATPTFLSGRFHRQKLRLPGILY
jgi:hypothetical protein